MHHDNIIHQDVGGVLAAVAAAEKAIRHYCDGCDLLMWLGWVASSFLLSVSFARWRPAATPRVRRCRRRASCKGAFHLSIMKPVSDQTVFGKVFCVKPGFFYSIYRISNILCC